MMSSAEVGLRKLEGLFAWLIRLFECIEAKEVSFAKEPYVRDDILQKRPTIWINTQLLPANVYMYGVASICRLLKIIGLFCKRAT